MNENRGVLGESPAADVLGESLAANVIHLTLLPSEKCNFRCRYCYERFELGRMHDSVIRGVKRLLSSRAPDLDRLTLSWFGGEPLLALDVIEDIHAHVRSILHGRPGLGFRAAINTNAYLLSIEVFRALLAAGVDAFQIAFDGPKAWHDRKRVLPDGRGTFDRVWEHVTALRGLPDRFHVLIRVHVDRENREAVPGFIDQCGEAFEGDTRFKVFLRPLSRLGGANDEKLRTLDGGMDCPEISRLREMVRDKGLVAYDGASPVRMCYASKANAFVVRADGRVNKCTVALDHPGNQVGRLHEDGTLTLDKGLMLKWMRGLPSEEAGELRCPLRNFPG